MVVPREKRDRDKIDWSKIFEFFCNYFFRRIYKAYLLSDSAWKNHINIRFIQGHGRSKFGKGLVRSIFKNVLKITHRIV